MPTSSEHPDSYAVDLEQVLAAVAGRDDTALIAVEHDHRAADALVATIAATDIADVLVDLPRPDVAAGAHPGRLLMYAMARQFRYDGDSLDLAPDYLEALNESLDRDAPAWAAQCAVTWTTWICHQGEPALGWPIAKLLLERYADRSLPALLLSSFAALAERVGDVDAAAGLWDAARLHHDTISSARTRWFVEYEWARVHLLQSGGAPGRASVVLERVQAGLAHADDAPARFLRLNACLEHAYCLCFIGRADDALASTARARVSIAEADAEFLPWLSGVDSLANALSGRIEAAQSSLDEVESAATDTTTLELAATLPARAIIHSVRGDIVSLRATLDAARVREHEHLADAEQRVIWRLLGAWALMHAGRRSAALDLLAELEQVLESATPSLPAYQGQTALLRATISADTASYRRAAERCADLGIRIPSHAADPWGLVPALVEPALQSRVASVAGRALRIDMLDGLRVMLDGKEASEQLWQRRRKSQVLLALLLASDGRVGRNELVEALWGGEVLDAATGQSRLSTVLSSLRRALPGTLATTEVGARVLKLHANQVELQLADTDVTDRMMLRELVSMVASEDPRDHRALARRAAEMITLVQGEPLRGLDGGLALSDAQEALRHEMATACVDVADRWLRAAAESVAPPGQLLELAGHASRLQPLDERMAAVHVELWARAGRIGEASQAFHRFRDVLDRELGLPPSAQLVRRHAQLVMNA